MRFIRLISALAASGVLLAACATPEAITPTPLPLASNYVNESLAQAGAVPDMANWWQRFNDPVLNQLVDAAQSGNLELKLAVSRIDAARAIRLGASSAGLPQVDLSASAGRRRQSDSQASSGIANVNNNFEGGLGASWEVDLFGRIRQNVAAAEADVLSATEMASAVRLAITSEVVRTYLTVRSLEHRLSLVGDNARSQTETARLTRQLFDAGAIPVADVDRADAQAEATLAELPVLELERQNALHRLSILAASRPQDVYAQMDALAAMPHWTAPSGVGTPADLLRQRPDVKSAEAAVVAAYARVGVARAELLPHLQLAGFIGAAADGLSGAGLARSLAWAFGAGATAPIFDGGRRRSNVLLRQAEAEQALQRYRSTVLMAVNDVEGAIAATARNRDRVVHLRKSAISARAAYEQINQSWRAGESAFIDTLQVQRSLLEAENALSIAEVQQLHSEVSLVTALGQ